MVGGLLNISFGSIAELVLALFVLTTGQVAVVQAQITGLIIGTSLLGLGLASFVGGLGRERQEFNRASIGLLSTFLFLVVVIALLLPAVFDATKRASATADVVGLTDEQLSLAAWVYTSADLYSEPNLHAHHASRRVRGRGGTCRGEVELAPFARGSDRRHRRDRDPGGARLGRTRRRGGNDWPLPVFLGVIVLALVGTSADLFAAVVFARQDRMTIVFSICIGSAISR